MAGYYDKIKQNANDFKNNPTGEASEFVANPFGLGTAGGDAVAHLFGTDNNEQVDQSLAYLDQILSKADQTSAENKALYNQYLNNMNAMYGGSAERYNEAVAQLTDAIKGYGQYDKDVKDFFDPYANQRKQAAMNAIESASAAGGNRFSSNYLDRQAAKQQALASDEWRSAYDRLMQDKQQQLQQQQQGVQNFSTLAGLHGQEKNALSSAVSDYLSAMANQNNADLEAYSDVAQSQANLNSERKGGLNSAIGGIGTILGAIFG